MADSEQDPAADPGPPSTDRDRREWDERYGGFDDHMWSSRPNGSLMVEVTGTKPGRALDIGCGEGADAVWLAEQGWTVTAVDISSVAVDRAARAAAAAGVEIEAMAVDVLVDRPKARTFDLIVIAYPALRRDDGLAGLGGLLEALTTDGEFLIIGHDHDHDHGERGDGSEVDWSYFLSLDDVVDALDRARYAVALDEVRERPNRPEGNRHTHDRILRIRRRP